MRGPPREGRPRRVQAAGSGAAGRPAQTARAAERGGRAIGAYAWGNPSRVCGVNPALETACRRAGSPPVPDGPGHVVSPRRESVAGARALTPRRRSA